MGNRIAKHIETLDGTRLSSTYYILDAQGNPLAMYELNYGDTQNPQASFELTERQIYGSARLGSLKTKVDVFGSAYTAYSDVITTHAIGDRNYELSNHLGNVLTVISDKLHSVDDGNGAVASYTADLVMSCDYSPFGVTLEGRGVEGSYRFGFNGMEADDEIRGDGNSYDFGARMYDSRVGRWFKSDPLERNYPFVSTYVFVINNPISYVDPDGRKIVIHYDSGQKDSQGAPIIKSYVYTPGIKPTVNNKFVQQVHEAVSYVMQNDDEKVFQTISDDLSIVNIKETDKLDGNKCADFYINGDSQGNLDEKATGCTVYWNPNAMLSVCDDNGNEIGGGMAPSTILLHECDHARGFVGLKSAKEFENFFADYNALKDPMAGAYDNAEEKRVISGSETKYIQNVNSRMKSESYIDCGSRRRSISISGKIRDIVDKIIITPQQQTVRTNHNGKIYKNKGGVNSIKRADGTNVQGQSTTTISETSTPAPCSPPN